jgi:hypothetical protein
MFSLLYTGVCQTSLPSLYRFAIHGAARTLRGILADEEHVFAVLATTPSSTVYIDSFAGSMVIIYSSPVDTKCAPRNEPPARCPSM